jgi:protein-tyrosine-phosphatase
LILQRLSSFEEKEGTAMTETILFLCPHHAAKSVIAEAYFNRLARQTGLPYVANSAGTEPDAQVSPAVAAMLMTEGIDVSGHQPRHVTTAELDQAARVISMGCAAADLDIAPERVTNWDIPAVSQNMPAARAAILQQIEALVDELASSPR